MEIKQIYTNCLAHAAYYVESDGEVAIFDPLREVQSYLDMASAANAQIKYVFETHFHADFVSGHLDLKLKTGATIIYGPTAAPYFDALTATDGQVFKLGNARIKVIHTPGHTMESTCFLLIDENGKEQGLITGDTLFIGDVGRPDLAQHVQADLTQEKLAGMLYDSLRDKIMPLSDDLIIYPNHGAGSACGKKMSHQTTDTLGNQKEHNYALRADMSKEEFIKEVLMGLAPPPAYFPQNVMLNMQGYAHLHKIMEKALTELEIREFVIAAVMNKAVILDTRNASDYATAAIPGSLNIGLDGAFASWVGTVIPRVDQAIILVCNKGTEEEAVTRLARVGFDNCLGFLKGGIQSWIESGKPLRTTTRLEPVSFLELLQEQDIQLIDVRKKSEFESQYIQGAIHMPLNKLQDDVVTLDKNGKYLLYCVGGYRSMIAASILKNNNIKNVQDLVGGINALQNTIAPLTAYQEPNTLL
ncbi:MBL fold metallo-hydrolase [Nonlabens sp.]|uniref:MBL fold metallo-hydrolase n=1 Tax=Nonlabens sp. TaxID=1888209 RepID=UPI003F695856